MNSAEKKSLIALPIVLLIAAGLAWAGSHNGLSALGVPVFALAVGIAFLINWLVFVPSYLGKSEKVFDLTGGITYLTVVSIAVFLTGGNNTRSLLLLALISVWAIRLAAFLFSRIRKAGEDKRFRELKVSFPQFLLTWTLQGLWVSFSIAAALAAITSIEKYELGIFALIGTIVWIIGFAIEVIADWQKKQFRSNPANKGKFIQTGLWSLSRHPNYFGEIVLWIGIALIAFPVLSGWQYLTLISPVFVYLLLTKISGIPMLEASADERWGGQKDYEQYKRVTSVLFPRRIIKEKQ
jgi:steroid 5-alpha reductase family enzyme